VGLRLSNDHACREEWSATVHTYLTALLVAGFLSVATWPASAQGPGAPAPPNPPEASPPGDERAPSPQSEDDMVLSLAEPDFTLAALPTTLRVPRHKSAFRVTHRFTRPLGRGSLGDLVEDFFGFDSGAQIGLEYRFGLATGLQVGIHRTNDKTIQFLGQYSIRRQNAGRPLGVDAVIAAEGYDNFSDDHAGAFGAILSHQLEDRAALYVEPIVVANANPAAAGGLGDRHTFMIGLGARLRVGASAYLVGEVTPRVAGYDAGDHQISFALEKRAGGHAFQINVSNGFGTTFRQIARGGVSYDDWFIGFNISRKFF